MIKNLIPIFHQSSNSFDNQESGERVVLLLRRHPFVILIRLAISLLFAVLPIILGFLIYDQLFTGGLIPIYLLFSTIWLAIVWLSASYAVMLYALDVWIVTDRRIIDNLQKGFFNRVVSELRISRIQDISVSISGPIETFLHFGNLDVQTAGSEDRFDFKQIPHPEQVKDEIMRLVASSHPVQ